MLAQTITPDTTSYLVLALSIFFALLGVFVLSMVVRARNLRRDEEVIEQLRSEK